MELRSYNVERIYKACVKFRLGNELGIDKEVFFTYVDDIIDMCKQISWSKNKTVLQVANRRNDGEVWTPYLQIVEMLVLLGARVGIIKFEGLLKEDTILEFNEFLIR